MDHTDSHKENGEITSPVDNKSLEDGLTNQMASLSVENTSTTKSTPQTPNKTSTNSKPVANSDSKVKKSTPKQLVSPKSKEEKKTVDKKPQSPKDSQKVDAKKYPNLAFYRNEIKSRPQGVLLEVMHNKWFGDYEELEDNHSYIQWLFPNFYKSDFNINASSLTEEEAQVFRTDLNIAKKLVKSYELILDFYGMRLKDHSTGELERTEKYKKRYNDALLTYLHNHLRIRRILTHLNNVGFRRYAIKLVDFLEQEIYGEIGGFNSFNTAEGPYNTKSFEAAPLNKLAKYSQPFKVWELYGDHKQDPERIKLLEKNCFAKYPEGFEDSVYFNNA